MGRLNWDVVVDSWRVGGGSSKAVIIFGCRASKGHEPGAALALAIQGLDGNKQQVGNKDMYSL